MTEKAERIYPIPDVVPKWESEYSDYPDVVIVCMQNGHPVRYRRDVNMPHPAFRQAMDTLHRMVGYQAPTQKKRRRL